MARATRPLTSNVANIALSVRYTRLLPEYIAAPPTTRVKPTNSSPAVVSGNRQTARSERSRRKLSMRRADQYSAWPHSNSAAEAVANPAPTRPVA